MKWEIFKNNAAKYQSLNHHSWSAALSNKNGIAWHFFDALLLFPPNSFFVMDFLLHVCQSWAVGSCFRWSRFGHLCVQVGFSAEGCPVVGHFFKDLVCLTLDAFSPGLYHFRKEPWGWWEWFIPGSQHLGHRMGVAVCSHLSEWGKLGGQQFCTDLQPSPSWDLVEALVPVVALWTRSLQFPSAPCWGWEGKEMSSCPWPTTLTQNLQWMLSGCSALSMVWGDVDTSKLCIGPASLTACTSERSLALAVRTGPLPHRSWSGVPAVLCLGLLAAQTENRIESSRSTQ